jgi:hypothetical protein
MGAGVRVGMHMHRVGFVTLEVFDFSLSILAKANK